MYICVYIFSVVLKKSRTVHDECIDNIRAWSRCDTTHQNGIKGDMTFLGLKDWVNLHSESGTLLPFAQVCRCATCVQPVTVKLVVRSS